MKGFLYYLDSIDFTDRSQFYPKRSFAEVLGDKFNALNSQQQQMLSDNQQFQQILHSEPSLEHDDKLLALIQLSQNFQSNAATMEQLLREARYQYLTELENTRFLRQDHQLRRIEVGAKFEVENLFFDSGEASLRPESRNELDKLYEIMDRSEVVIELAGHTDNVGAESSNLALSQARVNSVKTYLTTKGIDARRVAAVGYGETQPIASNDTEAGRQRNRRVELDITSLSLREGSDSLKGDEELDGLVTTAKLDTNEIDLMAMFRKAAESGGLPEGSECGASAVAVNSATNSSAITGRRTQYGVETLSKSNYIYRSFNPYFRNFSFDSSPDLLGAGLHFMTEKLTEWYVGYYWGNDAGVAVMVDLGVLWTVHFSDIFNVPLNFHFGLDGAGIVYDEIRPDLRPDPNFFATLPVGLRYVQELGDELQLAPEFFYHIGLVSSENLGASASHWRIGLNARYRFLQGGVFYSDGADKLSRF